MVSKDEMENFELFCYYLSKEEDAFSFSPKKIIPMYEEAGLPVPDANELKKRTKKYDSFRPHGIEGTLKFKNDVLRALEKKYGHLWGSGVHGTSVSVLRIPDFACACEMGSNSDIENFELFCYYLVKEKKFTMFSVKKVLELFEDVDVTVKDADALKNDMKKHPSFDKKLDGSLSFKSEALRALDSKYGHLWIKNTETAAPEIFEVVDITRCKKRKEGLDRLVMQINTSYRNGSFDSCALVMRRLLEAALIISFQTNGIENEIRNGSGKYLCFDDIAKKAVEKDVNGILKIGDDLTNASAIGDYSEQGPMYTISVNDINSVRNAYRNVIDLLLS